VSKIKDSQRLLKVLGMPQEQQNEMSALTLLALAGLKPRDSWEKASNMSCTITKGIMDFIALHYKKKYAPNTRETFRRHVMHQFVQGHIADYNPDNPSLPTNSPKAHYALTEEALEVIQAWNTPAYKQYCQAFHSKYGNLDERYKAPRSLKKIPLLLPNGKKVQLSPGKHNALQVSVLQEFGPRFAPGAELLYFGDTARKNLFCSNLLSSQLEIQLNDHDKLPDVILWDKKKKWLFLIEAVTSHGPMTPKRIIELKEVFKKGNTGLVFVSAFPDSKEFRKHVNEIAWETEVWIADTPDHLIHFNGDRFLGPH
jgi:hypothetical protein